MGHVQKSVRSPGLHTSEENYVAYTGDHHGAEVPDWTSKQNGLIFFKTKFDPTIFQNSVQVRKLTVFKSTSCLNPKSFYHFAWPIPSGVGAQSAAPGTSRKCRPLVRAVV